MLRSDWISDDGRRSQAKALSSQQFGGEELSESSELTICSPFRIINGDDHDAWNVAMPRGLLFVQV